VPNGGSKPSKPSEDLLLDELLNVRHLRTSSREGSGPPALNIPDIIASELHEHFPLLLPCLNLRSEQG
jgi:hypothetical protein